MADSQIALLPREIKLFEIRIFFGTSIESVEDWRNNVFNINQFFKQNPLIKVPMEWFRIFADTANKNKFTHVAIKNLHFQID